MVLPQVTSTLGKASETLHGRDGEKKFPTTPLPLQNHKETTQAKLNILFVCLFLPKKEKPEYLCSPVMTFIRSSWEPEGSDAMDTGRIRSAAGALTPLVTGKTNVNVIALPPDCLRDDEAGCNAGACLY